MNIKHIIAFAAAALCCMAAMAQNGAEAQIADRTKRAADQVMLRALDLMNRQDYKTAYQLLEGASQINPDNDAVLYYLGTIAAAAGRPDLAYNNFRKAYQLDSSNVWYATNLARQLTMMGRPDKALEIYGRIQAQKPNDPDLMSNVIEANLMAGNFEEADSLITRIEMMMGESDYTFLTRIELLRQKGEFDAFFSQLNEFFRTSSMLPAAKTDLLDKVMRSSNPRFNYAHLDDYLTLARTCLELHPHDTAVTHYAISILYSAGKIDELLEVTAANPQDPVLIQSALGIYMDRNDYASGLREADKLLAVAVGDTVMMASCHSFKGDCYYALGQKSKAYKEYEAALRLTSDDIGILNNYAYYMACDGKNLARCAQMSKKTLDAEPDNATYLDTYGWILYKQKKYQQAKEYFKKALLYGGKDSSAVLEHYAATLDALGETILAQAYREQAKLKKNAKK